MPAATLKKSVGKYKTKRTDDHIELLYTHLINLEYVFFTFMHILLACHAV